MSTEDLHKEVIADLKAAITDANRKRYTVRIAVLQWMYEGLADGHMSEEDFIAELRHTKDRCLVSCPCDKICLLPPG